MTPITALKNPRSIFLEAVENHSPAGWSEFLDGACAGDAALRDQVTRLLNAYGRLDGFMAQPAGNVPATIDMPTAGELVGQTIGRYKLLEQIGEGGMGVVYVAEQTEPVRRKVALKIIKPGMDTRQVIARFEAERQALALMDHPNIAKILDAGTTESSRHTPCAVAGDGTRSVPATLPYFVMELVRGLAITDYCDRARLTPRERLELFVTVCNAVQHAHQKGIIHRDLKPTNVLVTLHDGTPVVKVIDFGVAKALNQQLSEHTIYTQFAQMIGTPLYMSPEQAELSALDVDTRSDVYSLGVLLYELLTGQTPFDGAALKSAGFDEMRRIIREDEPPRLSARLSTLGAPAVSTVAHARGLDERRLSQTLRGELDWIVMKALEKDRTRRYESASSLAADLRRYLDHLPIQARPTSLVGRALKWRRRNPVASLAIATGILLSLSTASAAFWHNHRLGQSLGVAQQLRQEGFERETLLKHEQYFNDIRQAWKSNAEGNTAEVRRLLDLHEPRPNEPDVVGFEWYYLRHLSRPPLRTLTGHTDPIIVADVSPDAWPGVKVVASGDKGGELRIWELETGRPVKTFNYSNQEIVAVRFSPDGKLLATAGVDHLVHLWSVDTWREVATLEKHEMTVAGLAWSPDGKRLASSDRDHLVHVWNIEKRFAERTLSHGDVVRAVGWSPDGLTLATADGAVGIRLWDTTTWKEVGVLPWDNDASILCVAFSPDCQLVAVSGYGNKLRLFDLKTRSELASATCPSTVWSLAFFDNLHFASGSDYGHLRLWHFDRGTNELATVHQRVAGCGSVRNILLGRGGQTVVSVSDNDRLLTVWDGRSVHGRVSQPFQWPDGYLAKHGLVLAAKGEALLISNASDGREVARMNFDPRGKCCVESRSEDVVAVPQPDGKVVVWSAIGRRMIDSLAPAAEGPIGDLAFSTDDRWLAAFYHCGVVGAWNLKTRQWHAMPEDRRTEGGILAWSPGRNLLVCGDWNRPSVLMWDADRNQRICSITPDAVPRNLCFLDAGQTLAVAQANGKISLWNPLTGAATGTLSGHTAAVRKLSLSPDGRTLASQSEDRTVRLWHVVTKRELFALCQNVDVKGFGFHADGSLEVATEPWRPLMFFPGAGSPEFRSTGATP